MKRAFLPGLLLIVNLAAAPAALPAEGMAKAGDWPQWRGPDRDDRSEEHTSELQSLRHLVCRLLLEKKKHNNQTHPGRRNHILSALFSSLNLPQSQTACVDRHHPPALHTYVQECAHIPHGTDIGTLP